jgi:hypothetical protein
MPFDRILIHFILGVTALLSSSRAILAVQGFHSIDTKHSICLGWHFLSIHSRLHCSKAVSMSIVAISDAFDGGNAEFVSISEQDGSVVVSLRIKPDP